MHGVKLAIKGVGWINRGLIWLVLLQRLAIKGLGLAN